ncbi:sushi, von Willebrand factor type A, EGF and pentraxin domain-containing protein 1-like [Tubulanus polymorphus]|uniref:sushi, von Willebrand factor type A, EGF and pentraxin domain-containing protein 1-like n=1 Tax=Tubulanus polymorphus TaxID=672921 RepID=UPI003DA4E3D7
MKPTNGQVTYSRTTVGETAVFTCDSQYTLIGAAKAKCELDGKWNIIPKCEVDKCGAPPVVAKSTMKFISQQVNRRVVYTCEKGYILVGTGSSICSNNGKWTPPPYCKAYQCGPAPSLLNMNGVSTGQSVGDWIMYSCTKDNVMIGQPKVTCQIDGSWSPLPKCEKKTCDVPQPIANGQIFLSSQLQGSVATYTCDKGYEFESSTVTTSTCTTSNTWTSSPKCQAKQCGSPKTVANAVVNTSGQSFNSKATYYCNSGFTAVGQTTVTCNLAGAWSESPTCQSTVCGPAPEILHGSRTFLGQNVNDLAAYSCNEGYYLVGAATIKCRGTVNTWDSPPTCQPRKCSDVILTNGNVIKTGLTYGHKADFTCNTGFFRVGPQSYTCQADGSWIAGTNNYLPRCEATFCKDPPQLLFGSYSMSTPIQDAVVYYTCDTGFQLEGSPIATCQSTMAWKFLNDNVPSCKAKACPAPVALTNGDSSNTGLQIGSYLTFYCKPGYTLIGTATSTCGANGAWSSVPPKCEADHCGRPPLVKYSKVTWTSQLQGSTAIFKCDAGYVIDGNSAVTCLANKLWGTHPLCKPVKCGSAPLPKNGGRILQGEYFGDTAEYYCNTAFFLIGGATSKCQPDGSWSPIPYCQQWFCGNPPALTSGSAFISGQLQGNTATYHCQNGFKLSGTETLKCQADKSWSTPATTPVCNPVTCPSLT